LPIVISTLQSAYYHQHFAKRLLSTALCKAHIVVSDLQIALSSVLSNVPIFIRVLQSAY